MRIIKPVAAGLLALAIAAPAMAEGVRIYPYASKENYCPTGLQPITINGVICCGQPNQSQSYQQVMSHPQRKAKRKVYRARAVDTCPEGVKGCY